MQIKADSDGGLTAAKCFTYIISFNSYNSMLRWRPLLPHFTGGTTKSKEVKSPIQGLRELEFENMCVKL